MTFKIGDLVRFKWDNLVGEILEVRDDNVETGAKYLIKWVGLTRVDWEHSYELCLADPEADRQTAAKVQSKIDEAKSALEVAWQAWQDARQTADDECSFSYLQDNKLINIDEFGTAAGQFGWSSSSLYCS